MPFTKGNCHNESVKFYISNTVLKNTLQGRNAGGFFFINTQSKINPNNAAKRKLGTNTGSRSSTVRLCTRQSNVTLKSETGHGLDTGQRTVGSVMLWSNTHWTYT